MLGPDRKEKKLVDGEILGGLEKRDVWLTGVEEWRRVDDDGSGGDDGSMA